MPFEKNPTQSNPPMSATLMDALNLVPFPEEPEAAPPTSRLAGVQQAVGIFRTLLTADEKSAFNRSRIDAMFDGAPPMDQSKLEASGQALTTNLNYGHAKRLLDISLSSYVDLYSSLDVLVEVFGTTGQRAEIRNMEEIVEEELTRMFRAWPQFHTSYLRLCTTFIKHGVGVAFFDSPQDWKFRVGGFSDILIPRQTPASEDAVDIAVGRRDYQLHELYSFIRNPEAAEKLGWNVAEVRRVLAKNVRTTGRGGTSGPTGADYEALQAEFKNNDIYTGIQNPTVSVLHFWVREYDGRVSQFMCSEVDPKAFMFQKIGRFERPEQAFVFFTLGVGTNGTYHSVRGLGHAIFAQINTLNRMYCRQADGAMLASAVMLQPESQRALDELAFTFYGAYAILSPGVEIVEKALPNLNSSVSPAIESLERQLLLNADVHTPYGPERASPYRNQLQVVSDIDVTSRISGANLNLFYMSWERLVREMVRRVIQNPSLAAKDPAVRDFYDRCLARGVDETFIRGIDVKRTRAVRAVGAGSAANRVVALRELDAMSGRYDDVGRHNLWRDITATRVGHDLADRYIPRDPGKRPTLETKVAMLENDHLKNGQQIPVLSNEMHGTHLEVHLPVLSELLQGIDQGVVDPRQALPVLEALYAHISETSRFAAGDPALQFAVKNAAQILQYAEEALNNTMKALEAEQRAAMEAGPEVQPGAEGQLSPADEAKLRSAELAMDITRRKAELDMEIRQRKADQEMALNDAERAMRLQMGA